MEAVGVEISLVVQGLDNALIHEAGLLQGVKNKVESLKFQLQKSLAFLQDANSSQFEFERVRRRTLEIRQVAHEAEDVVQMFLVNAANERRSRGLFKSIIQKRDKTGEEIDYILVRLQEINERNERGEIIPRRQVPDTDWRIQEEFPWWWPYRENDGYGVVGMADEVEKLLRESVLNWQKEGLSIAVVEGMAGIGKTTFSRKIYNDLRVKYDFPYRAWVMVSGDQFTLEGTMKQLILQLPHYSDNNRKKLLELEKSTQGVQYELREMLYKLLKGKRYFIVLDNVWETEHWKSLRSAFPNEQDRKSILLVTTRKKYIATYRPYIHYEMKLLDPENSLELLLRNAFINGGCPEELEPIGRQIVERCEGLPLTICEVGGLLQAQTRTERGWQQVLNQISSHLGRPESSVVTSSELSYQNLPPKLRSCFLHLALFKEDATIPAKTLLHIWVVLGLIQEHEGETAEETAGRSLDELIDRNMLQIVDLTMEGRVKNCYLHGIFREVCLRRANEELRLETVNVSEGISFEFSHNSRHTVVYGGNIGTLSLHGNKNLRSLFLHNDKGGVVDVSSPSHDNWKSSQLLKILHLDGIKLSRFPDSLGALIRLKYLFIRRRKVILKCALEVEDYLEAVKLPIWFNRLEHLEILDMEGEKVEFPDDVTLKMNRLRHFRAYCVRGPMSISSWENIETLEYLRLEDWMKCFSRLISSSCTIRKLGLFLNPLNRPVEWREVRASLESLKKLQHLQLRWSPIIPIDPEIVPNLDSRLTKLKLRGKLSKCPNASMFPPNLTHLKLAFSGLREDLVAELSKLPKLAYLKLLGNACKAERMQVLDGGFPRLQVLSLREMSRLESIDIEEGGMPRLRQLQIQQCPSLQTKNLPERVLIKIS